MARRPIITSAGHWPRALVETTGHCVYAIRCRSTARIKFGWTSDLWKRWRTICTAAPSDLDLIGWNCVNSSIAARQEEARIFRDLAAHRVPRKGEWFRSAGAVHDAALWMEILAAIELDSMEDEQEWDLESWEDEQEWEP